MNRALIISGGEYSPIESANEYTYVIACDKGYEYAIKMGIKPDLLIGDFDSIKKDKLDSVCDECQNKYEGMKISKHPVEKDDTDTMLAIKEALNIGADTIDIICALGGRLDHTYANIQSLSYIASYGARGCISSDKERLSVIKAPFDIKIPYTEGWSLSLYSISDTLEHLTIKGTKYEVEDITLTNSFPLGYGNEILNKSEAHISAKQGLMLLVESLIK